MKNKQERKELRSRMNPPGAEERGESSRLFAEGVPVWYAQSGKVNPQWLSACKEERNLTYIELINSLPLFGVCGIGNECEHSQRITLQL